jgi:predicted DNA-binding protein (MmcQ/YjbR family)
MVTIEMFRNLAGSFPESTEKPHFEKTSFRVMNKIFATYDEKERRACIRLSEIDQDVFSAACRNIIFPVPNKWGKQGWTLIDMDKVNEAIFQDAVTTSFCEVAPKKLAAQVRPISDNDDL